MVEAATQLTATSVQWRSRCSRRRLERLGPRPLQVVSQREAGTPSPRLTARENALVTVIGIFGPTASGKSEVAEAVARADPGRTRLRRRDAGLRGPADPHEPSPHPERLVGIWPLEPRGLGGRVRAARARRDRRDARRRAGRRSSSAGRASTSGPRSPSSSFRPRPPGAHASAGRASTTRTAARRRTPQLRELDPAAAERVHANDRRRVVRALELAEAGASLVPRDDRLFGGAWRHPTLVVGLDVPKDDPRSGGSRSGRGGCSSSGSRTRYGGRSTAPMSPTARKSHRARRGRRASRARRRSRQSIVRTRRYAAYQRKWMREPRGPRYGRCRPSSGGDRR